MVLLPDQIERLLSEATKTPGYRLLIDLSSQTVVLPSKEAFTFTIDPVRKSHLLKGLDEIGLTEKKSALIDAYEKKRREWAPGLTPAG